MQKKRGAYANTYWVSLIYKIYYWKTSSEKNIVIMLPLCIHQKINKCCLYVIFKLHFWASILCLSKDAKGKRSLDKKRSWNFEEGVSGKPLYIFLLFFFFFGWIRHLCKVGLLSKEKKKCGLLFNHFILFYSLAYKGHVFSI